MKRVFSFMTVGMLLLALMASGAWAQTGGSGTKMPMQQRQMEGYGSGPNMMHRGYGPGAMMGPGQGYGYGPGMMMGGGYGHGPGMMMGGGYGHGPGMMMGGGYGHGPGMMMGGGYGYGPGMMTGPGMMGMMMGHMMGGPGGMMMGPGMMMGGMNMGFALRYLDLSAEQWEQVRKLAYEHLKKMGDLQAEMIKLRVDLFRMHSGEKVEPAKVREIFTKRANLQAEWYLICTDYLDSIKKLLTEEQLKRLEGGWAR